jgi:tetratricopeptide (TPR) repeat protein
MLNAWQWTEAESEFRRAIELSPNNATAHYFYALMLMPENRLDQALAEFRTALSLDPLSPIINLNYAICLRDAGQREASDAVFQKVEQIDPAFGGPHLYLMEFYAMEGRFADSYSEAKKFAPDIPPRSLDAQGYLKAAMASKVPFAAHIAVAYAIAGDRDQALASLDKAISEEDPELISVIRYPVFQSLHSDPRYTTVMKRIGLPE